MRLEVVEEVFDADPFIGCVLVYQEKEVGDGGIGDADENKLFVDLGDDADGAEVGF